MPNYSFRLKFRLPPSENVNIDDPKIILKGISGEELVLSSEKPETKIIDAEYLVLKGTGYDSEFEAETAGRQYREILVHSLAKLRIGVDFGDRAPKGGATSAGLALMEKGTERRIINDVHGLLVYESNPVPLLVSVGQPRVIRGTQKDKFIRSYEEAKKTPIPLSEKEYLAFDLFSASYFQHSQDARLLMLVMAIEVLISPQIRSSPSQEHVKNLIHLTHINTNLPENDRQSILGSLNWLLSESIGQAGRRLVNERLAGRIYMEMPAGKFFNYCYSLRSQLVHGYIPLPSRDIVGKAAANLETLVADLLCGPLLDIDI